MFDDLQRTYLRGRVIEAEGVVRIDDDECSTVPASGATLSRVEWFACGAVAACLLFLVSVAVSVALIV